MALIRLVVVQEALTERGWSARQASIEAVGSGHLISRMRRGQEPSVSRMRALCDVLGLECYLGNGVSPLIELDVTGSFRVDRKPWGDGSRDRRVSQLDDGDRFTKGGSRDINQMPVVREEKHLCFVLPAAQALPSLRLLSRRRS